MMLDINFEAITHLLGTWIISEPWVRVHGFRYGIARSYGYQFNAVAEAR